MFGKLREKLKNWTKSFTKKAEEEPEEEIEVEKPAKAKKEKAEKANKKEKKAKQKKISPPMKYDAGEHKYEPDLEKLEEIPLEKETIKQEEQEKEDNWEEKPSFFSKFASKISKVKISEKEFDVYSEELEMLLLENNVALEVAERIIRDLKEKVTGKEILKKELESEITDSFKDIIRNILISPPDLITEIKEKSLIQKKPYVILFCGINGTGKTTTIAKIAQHLKSKKISCVLAAGDTFRAASIEQLKEHGNRIGVKVISHEYGSDPASVGFDAVKYAEKNSIDCVIIDTAGRMHTQKNLLREMEKIVRVCKPDKKIFVGESITGNDSVEQVKAFDEAIGINGIVLTKADIDEKGGTALSVGYITKKPIFYLGTGQAYDEIEPFDKEKFIERLGL